jgi:hypothetical protein
MCYRSVLFRLMDEYKWLIFSFPNPSYTQSWVCLPSILTCNWLQAVLNLQVPVEHSKEVSDCKNLIKTLVMGNNRSSHNTILVLFQCFMMMIMITYGVSSTI